nr:PREDICTED: interleukin-1 receptor-like 1 isoform X1 [Lepisosteus oculatus]XP_015219612.1 PREDICTED: interleukin-1 receptor-like 1 isoform X1 [Lepisosteus oculatus]
MVHLLLLSHLLMTWIVTRGRSDIADSCEFADRGESFVTEQEAVRLLCYLGVDADDSGGVAFTWYSHKNLELPFSEAERIHHHEGILYFLPVLLTDSGTYTCVWNTTDECSYFERKVTVYEAKPFNSSVLYTPVTTSAVNQKILCPDLYPNATVTWFKDFQVLPNATEDHVYIFDTNPGDNGIYTCKCIWEHNGKVFNFSRSFQLEVEVPSALHAPVIQYPANNTVIAEPGSPQKIECIVFFGFDVEDTCSVWWEKNGTSVRFSNGYSQNVTRWWSPRGVNERYTENNQTLYKATLSIARVSQQDFHSEFKCTAMNSIKWFEGFVFIQPQPTIYRSFAISLPVLLVLLLMYVAVKYYMIDFVLIYRDLLKPYCAHRDGKVYDAYVVYPRHNLQKSSEEKIYSFVNVVMPKILETKCGYKLFIYGRDDLPGQDLIEIMETSIKLSRRLIFILFPGSASEETSEEVFDRKFGLYTALVQEEMKAIMIELEKFVSYEHLPVTLQHVIQKRRPLKWKGEMSPNSGFWKHVRYRMPGHTSS